MKTYNWEGVNTDGYFLDKLQQIQSALHSFHTLIQLSECKACQSFYIQIKPITISFTVFPEIVPSIGNSFINTMKNINHTRSSISDDIRNILCSSANMRRAIPLILRLLMN